MDIDTMPAGREMDTLIAAEVFQCGYGNDKCPHYSTDIAAAWQVVEKVKTMLCSAGRFGFMLFDRETRSRMTSPEPIDANWYAEFYGGKQRGGGYGDTAPLAICRAALKAIGYNGDKSD